MKDTVRFASLARTVFLVLAILLVLSTAAYAAEEMGVFVKAASGIEGDFDSAVEKTKQAIEAAGWEVLASYPSGVSEECKGMRAHNIVINSEKYAEKIMSHGPLAAFALPLRVGVYEDESGIHAAFVNPVSVNRTVLGDGVEEEFSVETMKALSEALSPLGKVKPEQIGQMRSEGRVGGMGGGNFLDKVEMIHEGESTDAITAGIAKSIEENDLGWKLIYRLDLGDVTSFGLTKTGTEAKAFEIAGDKRSKKDYVCPGLDHAAAFPIEVVAFAEGGKARAATLDEMYRMKLYFEDAGTWAFMKNMTMPGNIEDEVVEAATSALK